MNRIEAVPPSAIELGRGRLTWDSTERRSDRYGYVHLMVTGDSLSTEEPKWINLKEVPLEQGVLLAQVLETRESTHVGDLFRKVFPITPKVGEVIVLGSGLLHFKLAREFGAKQVGLQPVDNRPRDWLDIRSLYDCHEQTVALYFAAASAQDIEAQALRTGSKP